MTQKDELTQTEFDTLKEYAPSKQELTDGFLTIAKAFGDPEPSPAAIAKMLKGFATRD